MSYSEVEIIKKRAEAFLKNTETLIKEKKWDSAMFNLEQYCQLILKYELLMRKGTYTRTIPLEN